MILLRARALHRCCPGGLAEPESAGRWERERLADRRRTGEGIGPRPWPCCRGLGVLEPAHGCGCPAHRRRAAGRAGPDRRATATAGRRSGGPEAETTCHLSTVLAGLAPCLAGRGRARPPAGRGRSALAPATPARPPRSRSLPGTSKAPARPRRPAQRIRADCLKTQVTVTGTVLAPHRPATSPPNGPSTSTSTAAATPPPPAALPAKTAAMDAGTGEVHEGCTGGI